MDRATQGYSATNKPKVKKTSVKIRKPSITRNPLCVQFASTEIVFMDLNVPGIRIVNMDIFVKTISVLKSQILVILRLVDQELTV